MNRPTVLLSVRSFFFALSSRRFAALALCLATLGAAPARALDPDTLTVVVESFTVETPMDLGGVGQFYAEVTIDGETQDNRDTPRWAESAVVNWRFSQDVSGDDARWIPVRIRLFDQDIWPEPDDVIDLDPDDGDIAIDFFVDRWTGYWSGDAQTGVASGPGDVIIPVIFGGGQPGEVRFHLEFDGLPLVDSDGDGLWDQWETEGADVDGDGVIDVDLPAMGATPDHKDLFVELDWVDGEEPTRQMIDRVKNAFAMAPATAASLPRLNSASDLELRPAPANPDGQPGIRLWIDTGNLSDALGPIGDDFGGGNEIPMGFIDRLSCDDDAPDSFCARKDANFDPDRRGIFRYGISASFGYEGGILTARSCTDGVDNDADGDVDFDDPDCTRNPGGVGNIHGENFIEFNHNAGTLMHEIGHTLGLRHGGGDDDNCKPNYASIMNYHNSAGRGVRLSDGTSFMDFSPILTDNGRAAAVLPSLDESDLDETLVLDTIVATTDRYWNGAPVPTYMIRFTDGDGDLVRAPVNRPIDWDGSGTISNTSVQVNVDDDGATGSAACDNDDDDSELDGHDDWSAVTLPIHPHVMTEQGSDLIAPEVDQAIWQALAEEEQLATTDLSIDVTAHASQVSPGGSLELRVLAVNAGKNPSFATKVGVALPAGVSLDDAEGRCSHKDTLAICDLGVVFAREKGVLDVVVTLSPDFDRDTLAMTFGVADDAGTDPDPFDNQETLEIPVSASGALVLTDLTVGLATRLEVGSSAFARISALAALDGGLPLLDVQLSTVASTKGGIAFPKTVVATKRSGLTAGKAAQLQQTFVYTCEKAGRHTIRFDVSLAKASWERAEAKAAGQVLERTVECVASKSETSSKTLRAVSSQTKVGR